MSLSDSYLLGREAAVRNFARSTLSTARGHLSIALDDVELMARYEAEHLDEGTLEKFTAGVRERLKRIEDAYAERMTKIENERASQSVLENSEAV